MSTLIVKGSALTTKDGRKVRLEIVSNKLTGNEEIWAVYEDSQSYSLILEAKDEIDMLDCISSLLISGNII